MTFTVVSTEEKINWTRVPRVQISELSERGSTELVEVIIVLEGFVAADVIDELRKLLPGLTGRIIPHNQFLLISDTTFNVVRIKRLFNELNNPEPDTN